MRQFIGRIIELYKPFRTVVLVLFGLMLVREGFALVGPYIYGSIIDGIVAQRPLTHVLTLLSIAFCVYVLNGSVLTYLMERVELNRFDFDVSRYTARKTLEKLLSFSIGQHSNQNSGIKQSIISKGEHSLTAFTYMMLYEVIPFVLQVVVATAAMLVIAPVLGFVVLTGVVLFTTVTFAFNTRYRDTLRIFENLQHRNARAHTEILRNVWTIQANAQERRVVRDYIRRLADFGDFGKKFLLKYIAFSANRQLIISVTRSLVMLLGIYYVYRGFYSPGFLVIFLGWSTNALDRIRMLGHLQRRGMQMYASIAKYFTLFDVESAVQESSNPVVLDSFRGSIEFRAVSFRYPNRRYIDDDEEDSESSSKDSKGDYDALSNVSFHVKSGQRVAVVGPSGSGKSTLVQMLLRAYDPDAGQILIDGHDLRSLALKAYRERIGIVPQDIFLFDETLRYNIAFGLNGNLASASDDMLSDVVERSCIDKFYSRLERGFDTLIGERGVRLSGGERQRVGIARALVKQPSILIFDEATSNLDTENEEDIRRSITQASKGITTIIIAHRLSTIKDADMIVVMDAGMVVGFGSHRSLVQTCDIYKRLIKQQTVTVG